MQEYSAEDFISFTQTEPNNWICYCEVLMDHEGRIILARPSHQEACVRYAAEVEDTDIASVKDFLRSEWLNPAEYYAGKYSLVCIWYETVLIGNPLNSMQIATLQKLVDAHLLSSLYTIQTSNEYSNYLYRKDEGHEHSNSI